MKDNFAVIGVVATIAFVLLVGVIISMCVSDTVWVNARFSFQGPSESVVLDNGPAASRLWLCADGTWARPLNCVTADQFRAFARNHWRQR